MMFKILNIALALAFFAFQTGQSYAGTSTANATAGTGDYIYQTITNAAGHFVGMFGLCDGTAAASCATVTAGAVSITGAVTQSGTWNIGTVTTVSTVSAVTSITNPLPAGTNVIGHIIADSGSTTAVTQATAANLNATVVGTGTFAVQAAQSGTWNITNISGTVSLPTGAATSANQTNASAKTQIVDGSGNVIASTSNNLNVQCANCSGSGASAADAATFTAGTSTFAPAGGQFTSGGATACVTGHQCLVGITAARAFLEDVSSIAGTTTLTGNGTTGAGSMRVTIASDNTAFTVNAAQSGTWNITNISGTVSLPTGAATSANQTNASQKTQIVDGSGNVIASTSNNLNVQCANCSGSGVSAADAATFTAGTSLMAPIGAQFTSGGATACVTGHECTLGMTAARQLFTDTSTIGGTTVLTGNGTAGAGAQRVTIASDNTAFSVNATLQASGTTAIGKVDPNTIATWGLVTSTQNSTTPTNGQLVVGQFNTTPTTITSGNVSPLQMDNAGNLLVNIKAGSSSGAVAQGSTTSGQSGGLTQAAVTTSAPTYTTATTNPLSMDTSGNLRVVGVGIAQGSTTSGQTGSLIMGAVTTSAPTYTTAQSSPISLDTSGNIRVNCTTGCGGGSGGTAVADAAAFTAGTTQFTPIGGQFTSGGATACVTGHGCWVGMTAGRGLFTDLSTVNAVTVLTGTGAVGTGAQRIAVGTDTATIAGSAPGTAGTASSNVVTVQGIASMTPVASNITQVLGSAISATNGLFTNVLQGNAVLSISNPSFARVVAGATGGTSTASAIVPNNTTAVVVKSGAGTLYGLQLYGINAAPLYIKFYNATSATCGSGTPVKRLMIPANATAADGAGSNVTFGDAGVNFSTGITYCATTGITDADNTAPTANNFLINVDYN